MVFYSEINISYWISLYALCDTSKIQRVPQAQPWLLETPVALLCYGATLTSARKQQRKKDG